MYPCLRSSTCEEVLSKGRLGESSVSNRRQSVLRSVRMREVAKWKTKILERVSDLGGGLVRRWKIFARSTDLEVVIVPYAGDEQANVSPTAAVRLDTVCACRTPFFHTLSTHVWTNQTSPPDVEGLLLRRRCVVAED